MRDKQEFVHLFEFGQLGGIKMIIYKIFRAAEWAGLNLNMASLGAPIDIQDGYIHFSTAETVAETAGKYFAAVDGLMLLAVDAETCQPMKWEKSRGGALFPHLYRELQIEDIIWAKPLPCTANGHRFPDGVL